MENKVSIDNYSYESLIIKVNRYDLLLSAIFDSADLDLFNELRFDSEELQKAIKVLEPRKYKVKQTSLIDLKESGKEEACNND